MAFGSLHKDNISLNAVSRRHSLSSKLLVSILIWVFFAVIFTGYTLTLLWQLESGGMAINEAGTLRMRVYHMTTLMDKTSYKIGVQTEQNNFEKILNNLKIIDRSSFFLPNNNSITNQIGLIEKTWQDKLKPLISNYHHSVEGLSANYLKQIDEFVGSVDTLVKLIEIQNTQHISLLKVIQSLLVAMVLFSAFTAIYLLYQLVIRPLRIIQEGIQHLSQGELSNRIEITGQDEFGVVSLGFNQMAANLEDVYGNLEQKVHEKTAALEDKNHELSALYSITSFLQESHTQEIMSEGFLRRIINLSHADAGSIRLIDEQHNRLNYVSSYGLTEDFITDRHCSSLDCFCGQATKKVDNLTQQKNILVKETTTYTPSPCSKGDFDHFVIFHIRHNNQEMGIMTLYFNGVDQSLSQQNQHLIETLTRQLGVALKNQQLVLRDKQLAVMEERNLIAQGLHDSIAQSLSFLNMQVQMLQAALKNNEIKQVEKNLSFIQQGVQESYEDVRELLLNFRTRVYKEDFTEVIQSVLDRFRQQSKVIVQLNMSGTGPSLNPQQQIQVIFILQEALSNIRKHAKSDHAQVTIENNEDFMMSIQDDGCGFTMDMVDQKKNRHVGMSIMKERAAQLTGTIDVKSALNQGTCVTLIITKEQRGIL